jgi:DNA polymerase elongation subunit (family B)
MLIFDLETDGFLNQASTIHCLSFYDTETEETHTFNDKGTRDPIVRGIQYLEDADTICGHNILGFDIPVIHKFFPWFSRDADCLDTLLLSRCYHPNILDIDKKHEWKHMPLKLYGRHSLESYGYRLGEFKGNYGATTDWKEWSQEMEDYCEQDVNVTHKLWNHFQKYLTT